MLKHNLGYIPYEEGMELDFEICDSTSIYSGRNAMIYRGGQANLRKELVNDFVEVENFGDFHGYICIRFMMNCQSELGRYKASALDLDFSPKQCSNEIIDQSLAIVKSKKDWTKSSRYGEETEYSKFINLKFADGRLEHISL